VRAVHIVTRLNVGGIARYLEAARGAVDVLVRGVAGPGESEARSDGEQRALSSLRRPIHPRDARALRALTETLEDLRPDVVHTHASKAGALGRLAARRLKIPCVHTFHGHVLDGYRGFRLFRFLERRLAPLASLTATGPETAHRISSLVRRDVAVLPPGVFLPDPAPGARARLRRAWGSPERVALWVGRPARVKRPGRFVAAARAAGFLPVVAGATGIDGALCLGVVDRIEEVYAACDAVVCSSDREGTPYAVLEAMWAGRPVVAPPVGDVPWIVGDAGVVTHDLAGALSRLPEGLGARAAARVRERFPAAAAAARIRAHYATMLP